MIIASGSHAVTGTGRRIWMVGSISCRTSGTRAAVSCSVPEASVDTSGRLHSIDKTGVDEGREIRHALDLLQGQHVLGVDFGFLDFLRPQSPGQFDIGY